MCSLQRLRYKGRHASISIARACSVGPVNVPSYVGWVLAYDWGEVYLIWRYAWIGQGPIPLIRHDIPEGLLPSRIREPFPFATLSFVLAMKALPAVLSQLLQL